MRTAMRYAVLCVLILVLLAGCDTPTQPPVTTPPDNNGDDSPPAETAKPDLQVSAVQIYPAQPAAGSQFTLNVYVTNAGNAASGQYDIALSIYHVNSGASYPIGTFRQSAMQPGEDYAVYTSQDRRVNEPGSYQVDIEIRPAGFEDGNTQNNSMKWAFTVN